MKRIVLLLFVISAATLTGCASSGSSSSSDKASTPAPNNLTRAAPQAKAKPDRCIHGHGYGGIGASAAAFKKENPTAQGGEPNSYQMGVAYYRIKHVNHKGCVTDYTITESTTPTQSQRELLTLVAGIYLPNDAQQVVNQNTCMAWKSNALKKATGFQYAVGVVLVPPEGTATGMVEMAAQNGPNC